MGERIWKSWGITVLFADLVGSIAMFLFVQPDYSEFFWYIIRGLLFVLVTIPIPIILQLVDLRNADLETVDRYTRVVYTHIGVTILLMLIEASIVAGMLGGPTSWGDFTGIIFFGFTLIYVLYGMVSLIVWRILNKDISALD